MAWIAPRTNWDVTVGVGPGDMNRIEGNVSDLNARLGGDTGPKFYKQAAAPVAPVAGDQWFDTTANRQKYYNGAAWVDYTKYL